MKIINKKQFLDKNIVKIINRANGEVLYTSRSPIPYCKVFNSKINAKEFMEFFHLNINF